MENTYVKEENKIEVCRLCLDLITCQEIYLLDSVAQNILEDIIPQLNLDLNHDPKMCETCNRNMLACYEFKSICDNREIIDVKIKIEENTDVSTLQVKGRNCEFCTNSIDNNEEISPCEEFYNEYLQSCLPEWIRKRSKNAVPCKSCSETLKGQYTFLRICLETEEKIKKYGLAEGTNIQEKIDLHKVLHFVLSNKNEAIICKSPIDNKFSLFSDNSVNVKTEIDDSLPIKLEDIEIKSEEIFEDECTVYIEQRETLDEIEVPSGSGQGYSSVSNEVSAFYKTSCFKACLVPNCINNTLVTPDKIILTVPKDHRREGWCNAIEKGIGEQLYWQETTTYYVCEDHFNLKEDMKDYIYPYKLIGGKIFLKAGVVPHVFKCLDSKKKRKTTLEMDKTPKQQKINLKQIPSEHSIPGKRSIGIQVNLDLLGKLSVGTQVDLVETRTIGIGATPDVSNATTSTTSHQNISKETHKLTKRKPYRVRK